METVLVLFFSALSTFACSQETLPSRSGNLYPTGLEMDTRSGKNLQVRSTLDKNTIRFGRSDIPPSPPADDDLDDDSYYDIPQRPQRTSGRNFMRFGRDNKFLRFGRGEDEDLPRIVRDNKFMRFGRGGNGFLRFGRGNSDFIRFGRGGSNFMRLGRNPESSVSREKREVEKVKRSPAKFLRFGKSWDLPNYDIAGDVLQEPNQPYVENYRNLDDVVSERPVEYELPLLNMLNELVCRMGKENFNCVRLV